RRRSGAEEYVRDCSERSWKTGWPVGDFDRRNEQRRHVFRGLRGDIESYPNTLRKSTRDLSHNLFICNGLQWRNRVLFSGPHGAAEPRSGLRLARRNLLVELGRFPRPLRGLFGANLGFAFGVLFALALDRFGTLTAIALVPLARDLSRELAIAESERERERESDCA